MSYGVSMQDGSIICSKGMGFLTVLWNFLKDSKPSGAQARRGTMEAAKTAEDPVAHKQRS